MDIPPALTMGVGIILVGIWIVWAFIQYYSVKSRGSGHHSGALEALMFMVVVGAALLFAAGIGLVMYALMSK